MKFTFNKELVKTIGSNTWTLGKAIFIEGVKGVLLKSATKAITTSFDSGIEGVKKLTLEDYVGRKKKIIKTPIIESSKEEEEELLVEIREYDNTHKNVIDV